MNLSWKELNNRAYVPYSSQTESCLVKSVSGKYFAGVRIENISFPLTISAVQAACVICLSEGEIPTSVILEKDQLDQTDFWAKEFNLSIDKIDNIESFEIEEVFLIDTHFDTKSRLVELLDSAVIPNSDFPVSAILYGNDRVYTGVNVEVSDWALGLCAERVAFSKAVSMGEKKMHKLAVHTRYGEISSPCGACRQVIMEHIPNQKIEMFHADQTVSSYQTSELLPFSFKSNHLKK